MPLLLPVVESDFLPVEESDLLPEVDCLPVVERFPEEEEPVEGEEGGETQVVSSKTMRPLEEVVSRVTVLLPTDVGTRCSVTLTL